MMPIRMPGMNILTAACLVFNLGCAASLGRIESGPFEKGFLSLFDGASLAGWSVRHELGDPVLIDDFIALEGEIHCLGRGKRLWLCYEARPFADFILRLEYKLTQDANSGVFLRCDKESNPVHGGFEIQILDDFGRDPTQHTSGAVYDVVAPMVNASRPVGHWNAMEITCCGPCVQVVLNGRKVVDTDFSKLDKPVGKFHKPYSELPRQGHIGLQSHDSFVCFRNLRIQPL